MKNDLGELNSKRDMNMMIPNDQKEMSKKKSYITLVTCTSMRIRVIMNQSGHITKSGRIKVFLFQEFRYTIPVCNYLLKVPKKQL